MTEHHQTISKGVRFPPEPISVLEYELAEYTCPACGEKQMHMFINGRVTVGGYSTRYHKGTKTEHCAGCKAVPALF